MEIKFNTKVPVTFNGIEEQTEVEWYVTVETRSDVLKGVVIFAPDQTITIGGQPLALKDIEVEGITPDLIMDGGRPIELVIDEAGPILVFAE